MDYLALVIGLILGALAMGLWLKLKAGSSNQPLEDELNRIRAAEAATAQTLQLRMEEIGELRREAEKNRETQTRVVQEAAHWKASHQALQERLEGQKQELEEIRNRFNLEFREMADRLLEEKSRKFTESNKENLDQILNPLRERLTEFQQKVEKTHQDGMLQQEGLKQQLLQLKELNAQMSKEAINLTRALKGDTKTQGNWGEFILESILEKSGLVKEREYFVQVSLTDEQGNRMQPDVVVRLPEDKSIVIDSKVSLVAYERMANAETEEERVAESRNHVASLRNHIKILSAKNYQQLHGVKSLDFVLLFIPIEPAFAAAVQAESGLFQEAFDRNIVLVSPTTLLATLRTVSTLWRQEYQNRNAIEIAKKGGALYDKFVSFADDLVKLGNQMDTSRKTYDEVMKKLSNGTGNLVRRAEEMRKLGVQTTKTLNAAIQSHDEDEE